MITESVEYIKGALPDLSVNYECGAFDMIRITKGDLMHWAAIVDAQDHFAVITRTLDGETSKEAGTIDEAIKLVRDHFTPE